MFQRLICLTTIATVIACPLWCNSGLCEVSHCKSDNWGSSQNCAVDSLDEPTSELPPCCQQNASAPDGEQPSPRGCPYEAFCQGVCGGAVFEEPVELNVLTLSFFICLNETGQLIEPQSSESQLGDAQYHWHGHGGNYGRSLRTLHMSFLL